MLTKHVEYEKGVGPGAGLIGTSCGHSSSLISDLDDVPQVVNALDLILTQVLNKHAPSGIFEDCQALSLAL